MSETQQISLPRVSVARNIQTYKNIAYLLCSFFFSLFYFILLITGLSLSMGLLIIWVGLPIFFVVLSLWWQFAAFERFLATRWLNATIAPMEIARPKTKGWWLTTQARLGSRMTWKTLAYFFLKFLLSTFCFGFAIALPIMSFVLMITGLILGLITAPFFALVLAIVNVHDPGKRLRRYLLFSLNSFGLNQINFYILNGMTWLHKQMACSFLGMSSTAQRLEAAKIQAEQEHARAELAERRRYELVVNVSHELRAPVANIVGHLESLLLATREGTEMLPPATLQNYLAIAHQEGQRLGQLVDELLSLAKMEVNELRLDIQEVDVHNVVEEVYTMLMPLASRERQVTLVRGSQPSLPMALADRQRLVQILQNLVRNAITYTPAGGIVSISLETADEHHLALIVEDNGIGIPQDELDRIFERFYRADASRSRTTGGFGLGLAIVHDLVSAMGGSISVASTIGQGSRFQVTLRSCTPILLFSSATPK